MKRTEIKKMVSGILSPASIDAHVDASWKTCIPAATLVWSLAIEEAAKWHEGEAVAAKKAHETARECGQGFSSAALREAEIHEDSAYAIRALAVEG